MICACCRVREANKKNTHYLTDSIIRSCLNIDGSASREKGLYANLSNLSHAEIGFQRSTPPEKLSEEMGRLPNEEEIERAKKNPFAVDNVFCDTCEDLFTEIENEFTSRILPQLRGKDLSSLGNFTSTDVKAIRLFFYLQIWRSAICIPEFQLSGQVMESLRSFILDHRNTASKELSVYPMSIAYLETRGDKTLTDEEAFTKNYIAHLRHKNPFVVIMNDFVLQFYENTDEVAPPSLYGINKEDFRNFINVNETEFKIRILNNSQRLDFLHTYITEIAKERIGFYGRKFIEVWEKATGTSPAKEIIDEYLYVLTKNENESILNYTQEVVFQITRDYIVKKLEVKD